MFNGRENTQCQALERTQPGLPLGAGPIRVRTHDYYRHGTGCLLAALSCLEGKLIDRTEPKHTHVEWLRFLQQIHREITVPVIADNYSTLKHAKGKAWLQRHKRVRMHFTPTSSSWMNLVERFFADLTEDCMRPGSCTSAKELTDSITSYLAERGGAQPATNRTATGQSRAYREPPSRLGMSSMTYEGTTKQALS